MASEQLKTVLELVGSVGLGTLTVQERRALMGSATNVHGAWGSGRLLRTSLLSVLITDNGRVLVGAVTPPVLYADAARVK